MSHSLTSEQTQAVAMLISGQSIQAVATALGKSRRTVERWHHNATFAEALTVPITVVYHPKRESPERAAILHIMLPIAKGQLGEFHAAEYLTLMPGTNINIDPEKWEIAKQTPMVQQRFKWGAIEEVIPSEIKPDTEAMGTLADFSLEQAKKLVENCYEVAQLDIWAMSERRKSIANLIYTHKKMIQEGRAV